MNVEAEIKNLLASIRQQGKTLRWLRQHQKQLESLEGGTFYPSAGTIDFDKLEHKDVVKVVRSLGGKWRKHPNTHAIPGEARVDYDQQIDGVRVRCWAGKPPPSCKLVEYEEVIPEQIIPARVVKKTKLVCAGQAEPLVVAMAQANSKQTST